jgi:tRNA dimethylallyltransferase
MHQSPDETVPVNDKPAKRAVLIAGATASGKSALALTLAERLRGIIINADSMQVYRDLRIITARPNAEDEARTPHRLYGHVDACENYSVGRWLRDAAAVLEETRATGQLPIFVGGTGLYFKALTRGLAAVPPIPADIRAALRLRLMQEGPEALHKLLEQTDAVSASRLMPSDGVRIVRALEVLQATGRPLSLWHQDGMLPLIDLEAAVQVFLSPARAELYRRIDFRFDQMIAAGVLEEVRALHARRLDPALPAMKAHGVPWLRRHLTGEMTLAEAIEQSKRDTRHYSKRQHTWFRNQMLGWIWVTPEEAARRLQQLLEQSTPRAEV